MKIKFKLEKKHWDYLWIEWVKPILIAAILALFIRTFIVQPFKIPTSSMYSTLKPGDRIFVNKFIYGAKIPFTNIRLPKLRDPEPGDIVVFLSPIEKKKFLVKRFISGGGHNIQIKDGRIFIDGQSVDKSPFNKFYYYNHGEYGSEDLMVNIPEGYFYALGDNSKNSLDSRYWGFVPEANLVGRAFIIHWPVKRIRILKSGN
ncbi:MAG: signal peptidase I [Candidatus Atribacteria bacterium]|nr:signal peptidase I [Candidatus Atribacteria bacterium]